MPNRDHISVEILKKVPKLDWNEEFKKTKWKQSSKEAKDFIQLGL